MKVELKLKLKKIERMKVGDSKRVYRIREIRNQLKGITENQKKDAGNEAAKIRRET